MLSSDRWTISHPNLSPKPQLSAELTLTVSIPPTAPSAVLTDVTPRPPLSHTITATCSPPTVNPAAACSPLTLIPALVSPCSTALPAHVRAPRSMSSSSSSSSSSKNLKGKPYTAASSASGASSPSYAASTAPGAAAPSALGAHAAPSALGAYAAPSAFGAVASSALGASSPARTASSALKLQRSPPGPTATRSPTSQPPAHLDKASLWDAIPLETRHRLYNVQIRDVADSIHRAELRAQNDRANAAALQAQRAQLASAMATTEKEFELRMASLRERAVSIDKAIASNPTPPLSYPSAPLPASTSTAAINPSAKPRRSGKKKPPR